VKLKSCYLGHPKSSLKGYQWVINYLHFLESQRTTWTCAGNLFFWQSREQKHRLCIREQFGIPLALSPGCYRTDWNKGAHGLAVLFLNNLTLSSGQTHTVAVFLNPSFHSFHYSKFRLVSRQCKSVHMILVSVNTSPACIPQDPNL
jgi:hypothetical protein